MRNDQAGLCARSRSYPLRSGCERTALRRPFVHRTDQTVFQHPGLETGPDDLEHTLVGHPRRDARHQLVVVDPVEKFFEIKVDHVAVALGHVALGLGDRLMSRASGSEAVAVLGKRRVPALLENLQQGLLDQSVDDTGHAELSDPALRLGDFDPLDRLRLVGSLEQSGPDAGPVLTQVGLGVVDGHAIHARTALVALNAFPRSFEVLPVAHLLHPLFHRSRAFRSWFRHKWFGPFGTAAEGFTPAPRFQGQ